MYIYSIIIQFCISDTTKRLQRYNFFFVSFNIYRKMRNFARKFTTKMNKPVASYIIKVHVPIKEAQTWGTLWNRKYQGKLLMKDSYRDSYGTALIWAHRKDLEASNISISMS